MGRPARIAIIANGRQARAELQRTALASERLGKSVGRAGKLVAGAFAVTGIIRAGKAILANGDAYTSQLNKIEALTTAQQRAQVGGIKGVAKQLEASKGAYAKYGNTIGDAAAGVTELVKAGQSLPQALKSINATLVLAKAGELDVADASSLVATALKTFHLPAQRAGDVANYLANAANISTANVSDLGEALKFVAPVAAKTGVSAQQTAAYLAQLSNAGLNGTIAGEGLRRVMLSLQAPVGKAGDTLRDLGVKVFDAKGKVRPFSDVMTDLSRKLDKVSDAQRSKDLRAIFGLTGITPATTLLNNVDTIDKYTKGVERAGAAQKLAEANSKGLMGTLRRAQALFKSAGQQAFRAFSPIVDKALRPMLDYLERNQGALQDQARTIGSKVLPYLKSFATVLQESGKAVRDMASDLKPFVPVLGAVAKTVKAAADAFNSIPGPIKALALEAAVAALVLPKLSAGFASVSGTATSAVGRVGALRKEFALMRVDAAWQTSLNNLGNAGILTTSKLNMTTRAAANLKKAVDSAMPSIKSAAGIGGMLGLVQSAKVADGGLRTLAQTASGALLGFSAGGPIGAAIGGGVALLGSLWAASHKSNDELKKTEAAKAAAKKALDDLKGTIDETTGSYTKLTRATVAQRLQESGVFAQLSGSGLNRKQIVDAALGQQGALSKLIPVFDTYNQKIADNKAKIDALRPSYEAAAATDIRRAQAISDQINGLDRQNKAMQGAVDAFGAQSRAASGASRAIRDQDLATQGYVGTLKGLPKDVVTRIKQQGLDGSLQQVAKLAAQYKLTPKQIVTLIKAEGIAPTKSAIQSVIDAMARAASSSGSLGSSAGSSFGSGYVGGISAWAGRAEFAAAAMAARAHAAAMRAQDSHSPSKKTRRLGQWFAQGFALGIRDDASKVLAAIDELYSRVSKKQLPAVKKIVRQYTQGAKGLNAIAKAQEAIAGKVDDAKQSVRDAKQAWLDYRDAVKSSVVAFGDVTQVGKNSAGNATADGIVKALTIRRNAVKKYVADIARLKKLGLNGTALQQILDAGVDGGLQTAEALLAGGKSTIATVNSLQAQISAAAGSLGTSMANNFKAAGISAAQGLLDGLLKEQARLNRVAELLADGLVKAIKKKLKIKSPSRVFRQIGRYNVEGLRIGMMGDGFVQRTGQLTAANLVKGFGTPALNAVAATPGLRVGQGETRRIVLSAPERDRLLRGLDVVLDVSAATSVGARQPA